MLFNLFGKKDEAADDHIFTDKAYVSTNAKMNACAALARADAGAVFICWFPQTAQKFKDFFRQQGLDENRVWETQHVHTSKLADKNPVFVEHYPLHGLVTGCSTAQERTTIYAKNGEISDNLDLKAVASVFGESSNLQDFERRLNNPRLQLSNLDLNYDNQVDYLRVIESVENRTHVIVIQAVLGRDLFQDVATIDVEKDRYNNVSVQVVGDVFMYGPNYIYEPVYYRTPAIYASFWIEISLPYV